MTRFFICLAVVATIVLGTIMYATIDMLRHAGTCLEKSQ